MARGYVTPTSGYRWKGLTVGGLFGMHRGGVSHTPTNTSLETLHAANGMGYWIEGAMPIPQGLLARNGWKEKKNRPEVVLACLSFKPSKRTSSRMVNLGAFPPCLLSSSSRSRSRGSKAILLPPSKAEPACETEALTPWKEEELGVEEWLEPLRPQASSASSFGVEAEGATRRRERPPADDMV